MGFMFSCNVWHAFLGLPEKACKLTKYVLPRVKKLEKSTFNDDLVVISKEFKRLYINVNPSKWKSFNYRNIYSWRYSIIGKHSPVHTSIAAFEYSIRNCHSLSDYTPTHLPTISCWLLPSSVILGGLGCCLAFGGRWRRFIDWLYVIVKVVIVGFCSVITEHMPTCRDLIFCRLLLSAILVTVCCWCIDRWRRPIEQLYVIVKMLISCFCSESTIGCCHLAYRERQKLRPQMRKIQTLRLLNWIKTNCLP